MMIGLEVEFGLVAGMASVVALGLKGQVQM